MLTLILLPDRFAVCRLSGQDPVPAWAWTGSLCSITRSAEELSIVCAQEAVPDAVTAERDWRALKVLGPLDFSLVGILARLTAPLAAAGISLFAISTYDTDYLLVKEERLAEAVAALQQAGFRVD
jgi:uncharacterized protein